jgi:hypothetical protein
MTLFHHEHIGIIDGSYEKFISRSHQGMPGAQTESQLMKRLTLCILQMICHMRIKNDEIMIFLLTRTIII